MRKNEEGRGIPFFIRLRNGVLWSPLSFYLFCVAADARPSWPSMREAIHSYELSDSMGDINEREEKISKGSDFHIDQNSALLIYSDSIPSKNIAKDLLTASRNVFPKMESDFNLKLKKRVTVFIISGFNSYPELPLLKSQPEWAAGSAYPDRYLMMIRMSRLGLYPDLNAFSVFVHELSHIYLHHSLRGSGFSVPAWFNEGVAMLEARKWGMRDSYELASSLIIGSYIPLDVLRNHFPGKKYEARQAYVESFSFLTYLAENYGESSIWKVFSQMKKGYDFEKSFLMVFGKRVYQIEEQWHAKVTFWYRWIPVATSSFTLWVGVTLLFILGYIKKKSRERKILKEWEEEDRWYS